MSLSRNFRILSPQSDVTSLRLINPLFRSALTARRLSLSWLMGMGRPIPSEIRLFENGRMPFGGRSGIIRSRHPDQGDARPFRQLGPLCLVGPCSAAGGFADAPHRGVSTHRPQSFRSEADRSAIRCNAPQPGSPSQRPARGQPVPDDLADLGVPSADLAPVRLRKTQFSSAHAHCAA